MEQELLRRMEALEAWKAEREKQQITYPVDQESIDALNRYFMRIVDEYSYFGGVGDNTFLSYIGAQGEKVFEVGPGLIRYTAETSDFVYIVDKTNINRFTNNDQVLLYTTDTAPGGLTSGGLTTYYVVSAASDGYSFKLSTSEGGAAVNITSTGAGRQYLARI